MDGRLYKAASDGNLKLLRSIQSSAAAAADLRESKTPQGDNALHVASRHDREAFAREVLRSCPALLLQKNAKGETPLHVAARVDSLRLVKLLTGSYRAMQAEKSPPAVRGVADEGGGASAAQPIWRERNSDGCNPLHVALISGSDRAAEQLLKVDPGLAGIDSGDDESPLYLAVQFSLLDVVLIILKSDTPVSFRGPNNQSPLHAAATNGNSLFLKHLVKAKPELSKQQDAHGRTALHYSAAFGFQRNTHSLLEKDPSASYIKDKDGVSPLLIAVRLGHLQIVDMLLKRCPDAIESCYPDGRNVLHIAVEFCNPRMLRTLLRRKESTELVNGCDHSRGNTPLHLAVELCRLPLVLQLLSATGIDMRTRNKDGLTTLDISEQERDANPFLQGWITYFLRKKGARQGNDQFPEKGYLPFPMLSYTQRETADLAAAKTNTMAVVAALLTTLTFAAAFTVPGGYKSGEPDEGVPVLLKRAAFKAFIISDTLAMITSLLAAFLLTWAHPSVLPVILTYARILLWVAFLGTIVAFGSGTYTVLSQECLWLAIVVIFLCCGTCPMLLYLTWSTIQPLWFGHKEKKEISSKVTDQIF